jgi:hypothetical protein
MHVHDAQIYQKMAILQRRLPDPSGPGQHAYPNTKEENYYYYYY